MSWEYGRGLISGLNFMVHNVTEVEISRENSPGMYECLKIAFKNKVGESGDITLFFRDPEDIKIRWPGKALRKLKGSMVERMKFTRGDKVNK